MAHGDRRQFEGRALRGHPPRDGYGLARGAGCRELQRNRVYIVRGYELSVLDAGSETFSLLSYSYDPIRAIAIDDNTGRVMVLDGDRRLLSIDNANRMNVTDSGVDGRALAIDTGNNHMYVLGAGNASLLDIGYFAPIPRNYQGLWWNPNESGWGVTIAQQGRTWFAGSPYTGAFDPAKTNATVVGFLTFHFTDANNGTLDATVNSAHITKPITRQSWGPMPTCELGTPLGRLPNCTDLWWRWNESGWGVFLTQQGDNIFLAWYTYDTDGTPMWLVGSNIVKTGNMTYSGTLPDHGAAFHRIAVERGAGDGDAGRDRDAAILRPRRRHVLVHRRRRERAEADRPRDVFVAHDLLPVGPRHRAFGPRRPNEPFHAARRPCRQSPIAREPCSFVLPDSSRASPRPFAMRKA